MTCKIDVPGFDLTGLCPESPIWKGYLEFGGYAAEGYTTAFNKFQDLLKAGLIVPGKERDATAKAFGDIYQDMSERANRWIESNAKRASCASV